MTVPGRFALAALAVSSLVLASIPAAESAVVTIAPNRDNSIFEDNPAASCAIGPLFCGQTGAFGVRRALLRFDVAGSVPAGSTVTSVQVGMFVETSGPTGDASDVHTLHRLQADWGEGASECSVGTGGGADVGDATFQYAKYATEAWTLLGGDFTATPSGSILMPTSGTATFSSQAGLVADVQSWLNQPSTNFGWILIGNEAVAKNARKISSREGGGAPSLSITFTPPAATPPAVPDGVVGTPVRLSKLSANGANLSVAWDTTLCNGGVGYNIVYGGSGGFPVTLAGSFALAGSVCGIGVSSPYAWNGSPDPAVVDPAKRLIWLLVLAKDGATTEGSWGENSLSQERKGPGANGCSSQCGILDKSLTNTCGNGIQP
jgi:hypothetical protein